MTSGQSSMQQNGAATKLFELHKKIGRLKFLDPACGCGNFLVIAYRELRLLELEILRAARDTGQQHLEYLPACAG